MEASVIAIIKTLWRRRQERKALNRTADHVTVDPRWDYQDRFLGTANQ